MLNFLPKNPRMGLETKIKNFLYGQKIKGVERQRGGRARHYELRYINFIIIIQLIFVYDLY